MDLDKIVQALQEKGCNVCPICGMPFVPYRRTQKTCGSPECKRRYNSRATQERAKKRLEENPRAERERRNAAQRRYRHRQKKFCILIDEFYTAKNELERQMEQRDINPNVTGLDYGKKQAEKTLAELKSEPTDDTTTE